MTYEFGTVLVFLLVASAFVGIALLLGRFFRPKVEEPDKGSIYECGEHPVGNARFNFNPRFYVIALIFIIFEVEVVLTYPVVVVFRELLGDGKGWLAFLEISMFLLVLAGGLAYVWVKGDLDWVRDIKKTPKDPS